MYKDFIELLKNRAVTIRVLSEKSGISESAIRHYLYNGVMPTIDSYQKIMYALGYDISISPLSGKREHKIDARIYLKENRQ